jgi:hypothetical protein
MRVVIVVSLLFSVPSQLRRRGGPKLIGATTAALRPAARLVEPRVGAVQHREGADDDEEDDYQ